MARSLRWATLLIALIAAHPAGAEERLKLAGLDVTLWEPPRAAGEKRPLIVFSHGFHGCDTQSSLLMAALAADGYVVFAPNHADAACHGGAGHGRDPPEVPFAKPEQWNAATYRDRFDDIRRLVAALAEDARWSESVDLSRIGLVGHSLGGYTVLALGGAWPGEKLAGVKAVLALSPYAHPFDAHDTLKGLAVPVMYQGGTSDLNITPELKRAGGAYDRSPRPKYLIELAGAGHLAWTDLSPDLQPAIIAASRAFLDHYVKDAPADPSLTHPAAGIATFRYASELGVSAQR